MTIPFARPYFTETARKRIATDIDAILASGALMLGAQKDRFEAAFRDLVGSPHAVSVNSCTTALTICLRHFGAAGGEVLVPAASFLTDVSAILFAGAIPVLVDIDPETLAFDLDDLERKITDATVGLIWVHLTGLISDQYERLLATAKTNELFVIEDASHAHGATIDGRPAGSIGDAGCFSFYPTKIVTSGTGGMLTTADEKLKRYAEEMRLFGKDAENGEVIHLGNDWFLDEIRACVGYHHLTELQWRFERRRAIADQYTERLANQPGLRLLRVPEACQPAWYQYPVFLDPGIDRPRLIERLKSEHGIPTKAIYKPIHEEQVFREYADKSLHKAEAMLQASLCLPMFEMLENNDIEQITATLVAEVRAAR